MQHDLVNKIVDDFVFESQSSMDLDSLDTSGSDWSPAKTKGNPSPPPLNPPFLDNSNPQGTTLALAKILKELHKDA